MLPVVVCVDVEPDERVFDPRDRRRWRGFERLAEEVPALRTRLSRATGEPVSFTWFLRMDPQIEEVWGSATWVAEAYGEILERLVDSGDELGLHTHTWRWANGAWVADFEDPVWAEQCVAVGMDAFATAFGRPCRVHRGGDHFLSGAMVDLLSTRGVTGDFTVEPGLPPQEAPGGEPTRGLCPDYRAVPAGPFRSRGDTFPAPVPDGDAGLLLVPLLSAPAIRFRRSPLFPARPSTRFLPRLVTALVRRRPQVAALAVRSDSALGGGWDVVVRNLGFVARLGAARFMTASQAVEVVGDHALRGGP